MPRAKPVGATPGGTPIVAPAPAPTPLPASLQVSTEMEALLRNALNATPPAWGWSQLPTWVKNSVIGLLLPLALTVYNSAQQILAAPADISGIQAAVTETKASVKAHDDEIKAMQGQLEKLDGKLDKILWVMQQQGIPALPASRPSLAPP